MREELHKIVEDVAYYVVGSCVTTGEIEEAFDITEDGVYDILMEKGIETCSECGWWVAEEDVDERNGDIVCKECIENDD